MRSGRLLQPGVFALLGLLLCLNSLPEGSREALDAYHKARSLFLLSDDQEGRGQTWLGEAGALSFLGKNDDALEAFRKARMLFLAVAEPVGLADSWEGEGELLLFLGRYEEALQAFRTAQDVATEAGYVQGRGNALYGEAEVLFFLDQNERAIEAFRRARDFYVEAEDPLGQGNSWAAEADVLVYLRRYEAAREVYQKARELFLEVPDLQGQCNTWLGEGDVLTRTEQVTEAVVAVREALSCYYAIDDRLGQGNASARLADLLLRSGNPEGAVEASRQAQERFRSVDDKLGTINALMVRAYAEAATGAHSTATALAEEAVGLHERWRQTAITDRHRTVTDQQISTAFELLIALRARQDGAASEALTLAEEARSRVLLDLLARGSWQGLRRAPDSPGLERLEEERRSLEKRLQDLEEERSETVDARRRRELDDRRQRFDRELEWNHYRRLAARGSTLPGSLPLSAAAILDLSREIGNPILLYHSGPLNTLGFLILPERGEIVMERIDLDRGDLVEAIDEWTYVLANPLREERQTELARQLWDRLIAPFSESPRTSMPAFLNLIPHGPLHRLPFEALLDPEGIPFGERRHLSVAPSASVLAFARGRHQEPRADDALLTLPAGAGLSLPVREADEIARWFDPADVLAPFVFSYRQEAAGARHLFIATRGVHRPESRTGTFLELARGGGHDSRLSAAEIATVTLDAELVTLAACDAAAGRALLSDERLDLTRAFLIAGAASVLATRWKVPDDRRTTRFLIDFYRAYRNGGPEGQGLRKDEALTFARRFSRERGDPAQVWAAWVLVGDPR